MQNAAPLLMTFVGLLGSLSSFPARGKDKPAGHDLEGLQGTWVAVSFERGGERRLSPEQILGLGLIVKGNSFYHGRLSRKPEYETFEIDESKSPKEINLTITDLNNRVTLRGIYEVNGSQLKICHSTYMSPRPTSFTTKPGTNHSLWVFKREKEK